MLTISRTRTTQSTRDTADDPPPAYSSTTPTPSTQPQLPSYQDVERDAPPPSYESLYGRARAIKAESSGNLDFIKKIVLLLFGTIGFTVFLGVMLAIPIAMITMGAKYLHDCPAERYIPIYLVVGGVFGVIRNSITIVRRCCQKKEDEDDENKRKVHPLESFIDCFVFAWFIAGNVWVYRTKGEFNDTDVTADNYCDPTLYWFAFWMITAVYIIIGCCCCCCCFCGLFAICLGSDDK
ncbi:uncharacterized protein LOC143299238 isoform X2 [Babylonia areolata]|uniref:uncharacterized protein LOC143299238 isoform X2 n=1 Tax=Babylonia areolata TaxID=304850 RepID=UPI003FD42BE2